MWTPVYEKYKDLFEAAKNMEPLVNEMIHKPMKGKLAQTVCRLLYAAVNTKGAMLTLVFNGFGHDAMKLARSIFEIELNISWLKKYPADIDDYLEYAIIQQKQLYDELDPEQQRQVPPERVAQMMKEYTEALDRFGTGRDKSRPRNEWCRVSLYERAKEVGRLDLYRTFYREASSLHHGDIGGLIGQVDAKTMEVELAPSWNWLETALVSGIGCFIRCLNEFDEIAALNFKDRLENGPNEDYVKALQALQ